MDFFSEFQMSEYKFWPL